MSKYSYGEVALRMIKSNPQRAFPLYEIRNRLQTQFRNFGLGIDSFRYDVMKAVSEGVLLKGKDSKGRVVVKVNPDYQHEEPPAPENFSGDSKLTVQAPLFELTDMRES